MENNTKSICIFKNIFFVARGPFFKTPKVDLYRFELD